jgi:hypothetical protein
MAGLVGAAPLADLTPVAAETGAAEGDPQPVYTWEGPLDHTLATVRSYPPSNGGAPRLVAAGGVNADLGVWCTSSPTSGPRTAAPGSPRARMEATCPSGTAMTSNSSTP